MSQFEGSRMKSTLFGSFLLTSLAALYAGCSSGAPTVSELPSTVVADAPIISSNTSGGGAVTLFFDGNKEVITNEDAAIIFASISLNTQDATKVANFVNNTLGVKVTLADVDGLGDPIPLPDLTGDGTVDISDAAVLFAVTAVGQDAAKVNAFVSGTLGIPGVTVEQSTIDMTFTNATPTPTPTPGPTLVVSAESLSVQSNGEITFTVALANVPSQSVNVGITPSVTGLTASPSTLNFSAANFSTPQTVTLSAVGVAAGTTAQLTIAGPINTVVVPVEVTAGSFVQFFVNPLTGNDAGSGTAASPFQTLEAVLNPTTAPGEIVRAQALASGGSDVVVTIVSPSLATETIGANVEQPTLPQGTITVNGPGASNFEVDLNGSALTLNKGLKLNNFKISDLAAGSNITLAEDGSAISNATIAVDGGRIFLDDEGTSISNATIACENISPCIEMLSGSSLTGSKVTHATAGDDVIFVEAGSTVSDNKVTVKGGATAIETTGTGNISLLNNEITLNTPGGTNGIFADASGTTTISGGKIVTSGTPAAGSIGIFGFQRVAVTGFQVNLATGEPDFSILLDKSGSSVKNSQITVSGGAGSTGIFVDNNAAQSTIVGNSFKATTNLVGVGVDQAVNAGGIPGVEGNNSFPTSAPKLAINVQ